jgi:hypothetical protein
MKIVKTWIMTLIINFFLKLYIYLIARKTFWLHLCLAPCIKCDNALGMAPLFLMTCCQFKQIFTHGTSHVSIMTVRAGGSRREGERERERVVFWCRFPHLCGFNLVIPKQFIQLLVRRKG